MVLTLTAEQFDQVYKTQQIRLMNEKLNFLKEIPEMKISGFSNFKLK
jgi:hypothetical protein